MANVRPARKAAPGGRIYRPDIDGLRALAVLPVVAFHAGVHLAHGGFVGVDIFFVISGFLITQVLADEIRGDRFSLLVFYERRIRRILPALIAMLLVTWLLGLIYCLPGDLLDLSKSAVAAAASISNFYFWASAGYFDGPAATKPLLHTWSLAVEEQFYLVWPLLLLVAYRLFKSRLLWVTVLIGLVSFGISAAGAFTSPNATFYLVHTRFWELALGGVLALGAVPARLNPALRHALSISGLALILGSIFLIDSDLPFPGIFAAPPCVGAALIILAGRDGESVAGRLLAWRPVAAVGLISYSLYLWHWPITVYQRNYAFIASVGPEWANKLLIVAVSLLVAGLSWKFVEQPFRTGARRPSARLLLYLAAAGTGLVLLVGLTGWVASGFPGRFSARELRIAAYLHYDGVSQFRDGRCFLSSGAQGSKFAPECLRTDATRKNYLLLGDSHAAQLWAGLNATYQDINFMQATVSDCLPTIEHGLGESPRCNSIINGVFTEFLNGNHVDRVLLAARWKAGSVDAVGHTLEWLRQRSIPVTLIGPTTFYDLPLPQLLISAARAHDPGLPDRHWDQSLRALDDRMSRLASAAAADYISPLQLMCSQNACANADHDGMPLVSDREHFTADGSVFIARRIKAAGLVR